MPNLESILANQCALTKERPLIVGVSGGADSTCLMDILREVGYALVVAHFDHQLRAESGQDAEAVKKLCESLNLECVVGSENVRAYAEEKSLSIEAAARALRYRFLFDLARQRNAQVVAVGHTADDQVETVLMHVIRGSSLNGLTGMPYRTIIETFDKNIPLARPLLGMSRAETVEYCVARSLFFVHDASNDSLEYKRNRIRHALIPMLETYNPKIREALLRMSQTLKDDFEILDALIDSAWKECATPRDGYIVFDFALFASYEAGLQRHLMKRAMRALIPDVDVTYEILNRALTRRREGAKTDLKSGLYVFHEGSEIYVCKKDADLPLSLFPQLDLDVVAMSDSDEAISTQARGLLRSYGARNNVIELANGWKLTVEYAENFRVEEIFANENPYELSLDADTVAESLHLRKYRRGDRIIPLGMNGQSQKVSDLFVNEKIPRRARENWALLCAGEEIIWVAGLRSADRIRVTEKTRRVIRVRLRLPDRESTSAI